MEEISWIYLVLIGFFSVVSGLLITCVVRSRKITEGGLLGLSAWFFLVSPITFYCASSGLEASELAQQAYFQNLWERHYGLLNLQNETMSSILEKSLRLSGSIDREKVLTYFWHNLFHGFFKIFVPLIFAAIGTWSMVKFLDSRIKVVSNSQSQNEAGEVDTPS